MNKTDNKVMAYPGAETDDDKICRKSVAQIVEELRSRGINAELCKRA